VIFLLKNCLFDELFFSEEKGNFEDRILFLIKLPKTRPQKIKSNFKKILDMAGRQLISGIMEILIN
jgi:hypothetical protein